MEAAETVLDQIRQSGSVPEAVHYSSLIHAKGCVLHDMAGARKLFDSVLADSRVRPQACLYQALFESMVANHQIKDTESVLDDMKARGVEITPYIANSLIHGWALAHNIDRARTIYNSVREDKREPSTYEAMTRAYMAVEDRASAMDIVNEGLSRGYPAAVAGKILELVGGGRPVASSLSEATA
jgi:pentatricopeptide repeat protein